MEKRQFLKHLAIASIGAPFITSAWTKDIESLSKENNPNTLSANEDFWAKVRQDYILKPNYINLESGYYNIIPQPTVNALFEHIKNVNVEGSYYMRTVQWENKKRMTKKLAEVIGTSTKNLIITRNTTESLNMIIKGMDWEEGDEAVFAEQDYGAMKLMFKQVADRYGIQNTIVSVPNHPKSDQEIVDIYEKAITEKTKLLMVCHMINISGQILPIKKICNMAHKRGVKVMVDGAHCVGHFKFNIDELGCDFYGSSLHKWLAVPLGTGLLYVSEANIDKVWPLFAENERASGDISRLNHTGTIPVYHDLSIENAIDYYNMLGPQRKENRLRYLQRYWTDKVRDVPQVILNTPEEIHRSCAIANIGIEGIAPSDMSERLFKEYNIFTVAIDNSTVKGCRITPNVFTTTTELDSFVNAVKEIASS